MKRFSLNATLVLLALALMAPAATALETTAQACPDGPEYHYVSRNPQICFVILFFCDEDQAYFFNQCGCGCVDLVVRTWALGPQTPAGFDGPSLPWIEEATVSASCGSTGGELGAVL